MDRLNCLECWIVEVTLTVYYACSARLMIQQPTRLQLLSKSEVTSLSFAAFLQQLAPGDGDGKTEVRASKKSMAFHQNKIANVVETKTHLKMPNAQQK